MTYDYELTLITQTYTTDEIGNQVPTEVESVILCSKKSVARSEFYNAAVKGLRPEIVFVAHPYEYDGQTKVKFEGVKYNVIRTYETSSEDIELTCEKVATNG